MSRQPSQQDQAANADVLHPLNLPRQASIQPVWQPALSEQAPEGVMLITPEQAGQVVHTAATMPDWDRFHMRPLCMSPRLFIIDDFLSPEECQALIGEAWHRMNPSTVVDNESGEMKPHPGRTSRGTFFHRGETDLVNRIEHRIAQMTRIPVENGEGLQVLNYQPDQFYKPHYDYFDPAMPGSGVHLQKGGQRVATLLMYLDTPESGGETAMPEVGITVIPKRGRAFLFYNLFPNGALDAQTLHSSEPVRSGEKWVATKWIRESAYL
ncbi:MAG: 2OG-Fe(II) oxygenase [Vampirovibrionales bacterium]|nr:2OG-Fe(II) oxygenase [Vampirovibrionales bacterium]